MLVPWCGKSQKEAAWITGISTKTIRHYLERLSAEGYDIEQNPVLLDRYFENTKSPGRPKLCTLDIDDQIAEYVR